MTCDLVNLRHVHYFLSRPVLNCGLHLKPSGTALVSTAKKDLPLLIGVLIKQAREKHAGPSFFCWVVFLLGTSCSSSLSSRSSCLDVQSLRLYEMSHKRLTSGMRIGSSELRQSDSASPDKGVALRLLTRALCLVGSTVTCRVRIQQQGSAANFLSAACALHKPGVGHRVSSSISPPSPGPLPEPPLFETGRG